MQRVVLYNLIISLFIVCHLQHLVLAQPNIQKAYGGTGWEDCTSIQQTNDSGYIMTGVTYSFGQGGADVYVIKADSIGILQWSRTYGGTGGDEGHYIIQTNDGGYLIAGETMSFGNGGDMMLIKIDNNGSIQWSKTYGHNIASDYAYCVKQTMDGGYVVTGSTGANVKLYLLKVDQNGVEQWSKVIGGSSNDRGYNVQQTDDGGYIIAGDTRNCGAGLSDFYLVKTTATGNIEWTKSYGGNQTDKAHCVKPTSEGGYIVVGYTQSFGAGSDDVYLIRTDSIGNMIWSKTFGSNGADQGYAVYETNDNGFVIGGYTAMGTGWSSSYIFKTDMNGNHLWSKVFGGAFGEGASSMCSTIDGGYALGGFTTTFGTGREVYIVKTDSIGDSSCDQPPPPTTEGTPATVVSSCGNALNGYDTNPLPIITGTPSTVVSIICLPLSTSLTSINASCNGNCDGQAVAVAIGGTLPYSYLWSNTSTNDTIGNLCSGTYIVTVVDAALDTVIDSVTITQPPQLGMTLSWLHPLCNGSCDGWAAILGVGGTPPYTYLWSTGNTTLTITGLCASTYCVTVTDSNGCADSICAVLVDPPFLSLTLNITNANCSGVCDGSANVSVSGGTPGYTYLWSTGATSASIAGLCASTVCVTVTDVNGCTDTICGVITEPPPIDPVISWTAPLCYGDSSGTASASPTNGPPPYSYLWNTGNTDANITGLLAGTYCITITDGTGCEDSTCAIITDPPLLTITDSVLSLPICAGDSNGSVELYISGGNLPYTYLWYNGEITPIATGVPSGTYCVTVTDQNGCTATHCDSMPFPPAILTSINSNDVPCADTNDGNADLTVSNGVPPVIYNWSNAATTEDIVGLSAGIYYVTVTDSCGSSVVDSVTIGPPPSPITLNLAMSGPPQNCDGWASVSPFGGVIPYTILWDSAANNQNGQTADSLCSGTYCVTVTDANNCTKDTCVDVPVGISEHSGSQTFSIIPNPSEGKFTISSRQGTIKKVEVFDLFGRKVLESKEPEIDMRKYAKGVYFVRAGELVRKLVIQ